MFKLHNRDCLAVLAEMESNSVDLVATDPPYYRVKADAWDNQWASEAEFIAWLESVVIECVRVLKPTGSLYMFMGPKMAGHWFGRSQWRLPTEAQYKQLQQLFNGSLKRSYSEVKSQCDALINDATKPAKRHFDLDGREWFTDAWVCPPVQFYPGKHPCEKPLEMMEHIVTASTVPGAVVLDPFMGGGTTGVASIRTGRSFIGCEMEKANFDAAEARLAAV